MAGQTGGCDLPHTPTAFFCSNYVRLTVERQSLRNTGVQAEVTSAYVLIFTTVDLPHLDSTFIVGVGFRCLPTPILGLELDTVHTSF